MPDWQELVRQRLSSLALDAEEKDEVQVELAAHLEESYEVFCKEGLPEKEAVHRTFEQVADWRDLQRRIFIAKRSGYPMQKRVHQLWIPGFLTMTLSTVFLMTLQKLGFNARMVSWRDSDILFYVPWLLSLPFLWSFRRLHLFAGWGIAGNRAACRRLSCARAYCGVSFNVSDRLGHRTDLQSPRRFQYCGNRSSEGWDWLDLDSGSRSFGGRITRAPFD